jgi:CubicO group peptidase (beta-lactamase class C family)
MLDDCLRNLDLGMPRDRGRYDLAAAMHACHTPGTGIALIDGGRIAEVVYAGVRETGGSDPVTERTLFQSGSISKSVAAACALRLVADGVLDLDEDVDARLTSWHLPPNGDWRPRITLRQLLSHTAGLTVGGFIGYPRGTRVPSVPEVLDGKGNSMPVAATGFPGLRYEYSGGGYTVMQQLLVDVTGFDFPALAADLVLEPAGMRDSTYAQPLPEALADRAATGHHPGPVPVPGRFHTYPEMAAAGLWSTASDLARFFLAVQASLDGEPGALLPKDLAEEMVTPALPGSRYGLGLEVGAGGPGSFGHSGNDQGFENHAVLRGGTGVVMMTNSFYGKALMHGVVLPVITRALGWAGEPEGNASETVPSGCFGPFEVRPEGDRLLLTFAGQPAVRLSATGSGRWRADEINVDVRLDGGTLVVTQDGHDVRAEPTPR